MAKSSDPLANLDAGKQVTMPSQEQINDVHDHLVRLQKQVNEQGKIIEELQLQLATLQEQVPTTTVLESGSFESKVWETVLVGALSASLGPNKVLQDTPKAMQQLIGRAIRLADNGVKAAKEYQMEQEKNKELEEVAKANDPLKNLLV